MSKLLTFFADHWLWLTMPIAVVGYALAVADFICGWSPKTMSPHLGYNLLLVIGVFWVFAPSMFKKYRTKVT